MTEKKKPSLDDMRHWLKKNKRIDIDHEGGFSVSENAQAAEKGEAVDPDEEIVVDDQEDLEKLADEINAATADYDRKNICYKNAQNTADALERKHQEDKIGKCFWNPYKWNINKW